MAAGGAAARGRGAGAAGRSAPSSGPSASIGPRAALAFESLRGKPLLINFWATWCPPCIEELPLIDRFFRDHAANGWQVVGLAIDQPSAVRKFLERTPVSFPVGLAGMQGTELVKNLGNTKGGLPFTLVINRGGNLRPVKWASSIKHSSMLGTVHKFTVRIRYIIQHLAPVRRNTLIFKRFEFI